MNRIIQFKYFFFSFLFFLFQYKADLLSQISDNIDSLVQNANAVVLQYDVVMNIINNSNINYTVNKKILIKNKLAEDYCTVAINESVYRSVTDIEAIITNSTGRKLKELDGDNIKEVEYSPGFILYSGNNYKWFTLTANEYPYIINYKYTVDLESLFFWPDWYPQSKIPCLLASYKIILGEAIKFNYYNVGIKVEPGKYLDNSNTVYEWELKDIPPLIQEDYMLPENREQLAIHFSPAVFELDGYTGEFGNWNAIGRWYKSLTKGKYHLSPQAVNECKDLVKNISDDETKVRLLYNHLQTQNRYVAIELGIGGWQPQSANDVYTNRYGDCKDLSTLMVAMLNAVGIKSYPALALTRDDGMVLNEFPSNQFNHCIAYVPMMQDTIWLECTSSYADMTDTPYNIEDIYVLAINDTGGELIKTSQKNASSNYWISSVKGNLTNKGELIFDAVINCGGNQKNYLKDNLIVNDSEKDILFLKNQFGRVHSNLIIDNYSTEQSSENFNDYTLRIEGVYKKFNPKSGNRIFICPNVFNKKTVKSLPDEPVDERNFPVFYHYPYIDVDTISIEIPKGYKLSYLPENVTLNTSFAGYTAEFRFENGFIHYIRTFEISKNIIPVDEYEEYINFSKNVIKSDQAKYVFVR